MKISKLSVAVLGIGALALVSDVNADNFKGNAKAQKLNAIKADAQKLRDFQRGELQKAGKISGGKIVTDVHSTSSQSLGAIESQKIQDILRKKSGDSTVEKTRDSLSHAEQREILDAVNQEALLKSADTKKALDAIAKKGAVEGLRSGSVKAVTDAMGILKVEGPNKSRFKTAMEMNLKNVEELEAKGILKPGASADARKALVDLANAMKGDMSDPQVQKLFMDMMAFYDGTALKTKSGTKVLALETAVSKYKSLKKADNPASLAGYMALMRKAGAKIFADKAVGEPGAHANGLAAMKGFASEKLSALEEYNGKVKEAVDKVVACTG